MLDPPDGHHDGLQGHKGGGGYAVPEQAPRHPFHCHKAHACPLAHLHQLLLLGAGEVAVGELEGGIQPGINGLPGHRQAVVGDADVADLALGLGLQSGIVEAVLPAGAGDKGGIVELIDVDIVCIQVSQAGLQVLPQLPARLGVGLGGNYHLVPYAREGIAQLLLAVGVGPGGVKVVYAPVHRLAQEPGGLLFGDALDGQTAKAVFLDLNAGGT